jgi:hypothetical protein
LAAVALLLTALPVFAQGTAAVARGELTVRQAGEHEFTLGGSGDSNRDFDDSNGGVNCSYGWYTTPTQLPMRCSNAAVFFATPAISAIAATTISSTGVSASASTSKLKQL